MSAHLIRFRLAAVAPCRTSAAMTGFLGRRAEESEPGEDRIVRFRYHQRDEDQHQHRRQQDGVDERQPFPGHVHEDGDDEAGLQHHEQQDQRPPEIALDAEIIDHVGGRAEHEEQAPDEEVEPDRVLLSGMCLCMRRFDVCMRRCLVHDDLTTDRKKRR
ncbi:hypothetical protein RHECNPAF_4310010 [Rhizobium etli CNPAF512]|nr:hypothetical protein RHECNPAF_4310010 [Rhizobium etli CNPAF512]